MGEISEAGTSGSWMPLGVTRWTFLSAPARPKLTWKCSRRADRCGEVGGVKGQWQQGRPQARCRPVAGGAGRHVRPSLALVGSHAVLVLNLCRAGACALGRAPHAHAHSHAHAQSPASETAQAAVASWSLCACGVLIPFCGSRLFFPHGPQQPPNARSLVIVKPPMAHRGCPRARRPSRTELIQHRKERNTFGHTPRELRYPSVAMFLQPTMRLVHRPPPPGAPSVPRDGDKSDPERGGRRCAPLLRGRYFAPATTSSATAQGPSLIERPGAAICRYPSQNWLGPRLRC